MRNIFFLGNFGLLLCQVTSLRTLESWSDLFESDARLHFTSDYHLQQSHISVLSNLQKESSHVNKNTFVVRFSESCRGKCQQAIAEFVGTQHHQVIKQDYAQVTSTYEKLRGFQTEYPTLLLDFVPMLPQLKIDRQLNPQDCNKPIRSLMMVTSILDTFEANELETFIDKFIVDNNLPKERNNIRVNRRNRFVVTVDCMNLQRAITFFSSLPYVLWVEEKYETKLRNRWAVGICQSGQEEERQVYQSNITGRDVIIGVADTGLDMNSCYFYDPNQDAPFDVVNTQHRKVVYYDTFVDNIDGGDGHGTHVCGSAAGRSVLDYGDYKKYNGNAEDAKIAFFDIGNIDANGVDNLDLPNNYNDDLMLVLHNVGARIHSHSWGDSNPGYSAGASAVDDFMVENPDSLVLFAAGNDGEEGLSSVGAPATFKNGVCVGASMNDIDSWYAYQGKNIDPDIFGKENVASFSSRGPTADGRLKPDVLAPGFFTTSALVQNSASPGHCATQALSGTSMATPTVAGNAALIYEYFQDGYYPSGNKTEEDEFTPSGALIKAMLINSGENLPYVSYYETSPSTGEVTKTWQISTDGYPSNYQGYGRINLRNIINFYESDPNNLSLFVMGSSNTSSKYYKSIDTLAQVDNYELHVANDISELRVTLVYTDPIPASGAVSKLVNDLDVTCSNDTHSFLPLHGVRTDNVEMIVITNPKPNGYYTISVSANILSSKQSYALVVNGGVKYKYTASNSEYVRATSKMPISRTVWTIIAILCIAILLIGSVICLIFTCTTPTNEKPQDRGAVTELELAGRVANNGNVML